MKYCKPKSNEILAEVELKHLWKKDAYLEDFYRKAYSWFNKWKFQPMSNNTAYFIS